MIRFIMTNHGKMQSQMQTLGSSFYPPPLLSLKNSLNGAVFAWGERVQAASADPGPVLWSPSK